MGNYREWDFVDSAYIEIFNWVDNPASTGAEQPDPQCFPMDDEVDL